MASKRGVSVLTRSIEHLPSPTAASRTATASAPASRSLRASRAQQTRLQSTSAAPFASSFCPFKTNTRKTSAATLMPQPRLRQPKRHFTTTLIPRKDDTASNPSSESSTSEPQSAVYSFPDIQSLAAKPDPKRILIDVREPGELQSTGKIPGSRNLPVTSAADAFFLPAEEFEERYGFEKPGNDDEVIFYCKAGVRSRAAARLARQAGFAGKVGEFPGSWIEWEKNGGDVERVS